MPAHAGAHRGAPPAGISFPIFPFRFSSVSLLFVATGAFPCGPAGSLSHGWATLPVLSFFIYANSIHPRSRSVNRSFCIGIFSRPLEIFGKQAHKRLFLASLPKEYVSRAGKIAARLPVLEARAEFLRSFSQISRFLSRPGARRLPRFGPLLHASASSVLTPVWSMCYDSAIASNHFFFIERHFALWKTARTF
jgi:hypothetical protein